MKLTTTDYVKIVKHYGLSVPLFKKTRKINKKRVKSMAEKVLATKLCRCIKAVSKSSKLPEPSAIAICNKHIFRNRGLKYHRFTCKKRNALHKKKGEKSSNKLSKTKRQIKLKSKTKTKNNRRSTRRK